MGMTGTINRFVKPLCLSPRQVSHQAADSQNDLLMWLMSEAKGVERSLEGVARRLLFINFSVHTTSSASDNILLPPMMES
jgi:hypothetical protein